MKTISLSLYNRPAYTKLVLDHLNNCFDIENYKIFICCEPINNEVIELAKAFRPDQTSLIVNPKKLGCNINIYQSLFIGFQNNDFHIHLEDDTVPAKDFLVYCEWARFYFKDRPEIFSISGYVNSNNVHIEQSINLNNNYNLVSTRNWFTPWGWATWIDRWHKIENVFKFASQREESWDLFVHQAKKDALEVFPSVARIQNVGAENGSYCPGPEWHKDNQYNEYWIETTQEYAIKFKEMNI
jgi:hypothetical protein